MEIKEIISQQVLDKFIGSQNQSQFLQSWQWGELQKSLGRMIWRLGAIDGGQLVGCALAIKHDLPMGRCYFYCPRGPVVNEKLPVEKYQAVFGALLENIVSRAEKAGAMFVKIEPPMEKHSRQIFHNLISPYSSKPSHFVQPPDTWYLDLRQTEAQLLEQMHHKTRYNIRLAEKKGVTIRLGGSDDDFEKFWRLNVMTVKRDDFRSHPRQYYHQMFKTLSPTGFLKLFLAEYQKKAVCANLAIFFGDTATYLHGASANEYRNLMAPHLLQWRQILQAKQAGFRYYDFWGLLPQRALKATTENAERQPLKSLNFFHNTDSSWQGITRFKKGFGGFEVNYIGACDLILNKFWYKLYQLTRKIL